MSAPDVRSSTQSVRDSNEVLDGAEHLATADEWLKARMCDEPALVVITRGSVIATPGSGRPASQAP